ncbi:MAG: ZIP family metal transporter, partial [Ruminococcus sp.]
MTVFEWVVVITAVAGVGGTGMGGLIGALFKNDSEKSVSFLLSFAAGVMLSVVCFDLLAEAVTLRSGLIHVFMTAGMVMLGYGVIFLLNFFIDKCTNHEVSHIDKQHPKTADQLSELIHSDHYEEH